MPITESEASYRAVATQLAEVKKAYDALFKERKDDFYELTKLEELQDELFQQMMDMYKKSFSI